MMDLLIGKVSMPVIAKRIRYKAQTIDNDTDELGYLGQCRFKLLLRRLCDTIKEVVLRRNVGQYFCQVEKKAILNVFNLAREVTGQIISDSLQGLQLGRRCSARGEVL